MKNSKMSLFLIFLWLLLINTYADDVSEDLSNGTLTKYSSKEWLQGQNVKVNKSNKYCDICCIEILKNTVGKKCGSHTLCKYNEQIGPACKGFINVAFTESEKKAIVDKHNTLRNRVALGEVHEGSPGPQPRASNMRLMEWNEELAKIAQRWAWQCIYSNDICRDIDKFPVGQNIARGKFATNQVLSLVDNWFAEVKHFNNSHVIAFVISKNNGHNIRRYTQLVWADTYFIGCARVIFHRSKGSGIEYTEHLICNYGPTGNIPYQRVYKVGTPCEDCQEGTGCTSEYAALCSSDVADDLEDYLESFKSGQSTVPLKETLIFLFLSLLFYLLSLQ